MRSKNNFTPLNDLRILWFSMIEFTLNGFIRRLTFWTAWITLDSLVFVVFCHGICDCRYNYRYDFVILNIFLCDWPRIQYTYPDHDCILNWHPLFCFILCGCTQLSVIVYTVNDIALSQFKQNNVVLLKSAIFCIGQITIKKIAEFFFPLQAS